MRRHTTRGETASDSATHQEAPCGPKTSRTTGNYTLLAQAPAKRERERERCVSDADASSSNPKRSHNHPRHVCRKRPHAKHISLITRSGTSPNIPCKRSNRSKGPTQTKPIRTRQPNPGRHDGHIIHRTNSQLQPPTKNKACRQRQQCCTRRNRAHFADTRSSTVESPATFAAICPGERRLESAPLQTLRSA